MATDTSMFSGVSLLDTKADENAAIRDNALKTAQLARGRGSVYLAGQAGGMLISNLADMAGMKTHKQEKAELITRIMEESKNLDPNDPKSSLILSRKFIQAGFPSIGQKFADKARTMTVADRTYGLDVRKTEATEEQVDILRTAEDRAAYEFSQTMEFKLKEFDQLVYQFDETHSQDQLVQEYKEKQDAILNEMKEKDMDRDDAYLVLALNELEFKEAQSKLDETHRGKVLSAQEMRDEVDKIYKEKSIAIGESEAETKRIVAETESLADKRTKQMIDDEAKELKAEKIQTDFVGDVETIDGKIDLRKLLKDGGFGGTTVYKDLGDEVVALTSSQRADERLEIQLDAQAKKDLEGEQDNIYKPVVYGTNDGDMMAAGFLRIAGSDMGETEEKTMSGIMGAEIKSYDLALSADRQPDDEGVAEGVTPTEARLGGYYERALAFPGVYKSGEWSVKQDAAFDSLLFKEVLNKSFSRGGAQVEWAERGDFVRAGLIVPNKTVLIGEDGMIGTVTEEVLAFMINKYNK